jgi:hypothetical protein
LLSGRYLVPANMSDVSTGGVKDGSHRLLPFGYVGVPVRRNGGAVRHHEGRSRTARRSSVGDTDFVPIETPDEVHIASGPRWEEVRTALDDAEEHLTPPLRSSELARGWTEDLRVMILASVKRIKTELASEPFVKRDHYGSWIKAEVVDPRVEDERWSYALGPDRAVIDLRRAEELLLATLALIHDLPNLSSSEPSRAWTTAEEERAIGSLESIASTLQIGDFVTLRQFRYWDTVLHACGVVRNDDYFRLAGGLPKTRIIGERPAGLFWDRIEQYDTLLVHNADRDVHRGLD